MSVPVTSRRVLSALEAAAHVGLSASTLAKLRVFGGGPRYLKVGRRVLYAPFDLDQWLAAHSRETTSDGVLRWRPQKRRASSAVATA